MHITPVKTRACSSNRGSRYPTDIIGAKSRGFIRMAVCNVILNTGKYESDVTIFPRVPQCSLMETAYPLFPSFKSVRMMGDFHVYIYLGTFLSQLPSRFDTSNADSTELVTRLIELIRTSGSSILGNSKDEGKLVGLGLQDRKG